MCPLYLLDTNFQSCLGYVFPFLSPDHLTLIFSWLRSDFMVFIITKLSTYLHDTKHLYSLEMYVGTVQYHSRGKKITLVTLFGLYWLQSGRNTTFSIQYENCVYHLENFLSGIGPWGGNYRHQKKQNSQFMIPR